MAARLLDQLQRRRARRPRAAVRAAVVLLVAALPGTPASLIDPDTPKAARTAFDKFGRAFSLVMSDEFNLGGRSFEGDTDPIWTATHNRDLTNSARRSTPLRRRAAQAPRRSAAPHAATPCRPARTPCARALAAQWASRTCAPTT